MIFPLLRWGLRCPELNRMAHDNVTFSFLGRCVTAVLRYFWKIRARITIVYACLTLAWFGVVWGCVYHMDKIWSLVEAFRNFNP